MIFTYPAAVSKNVDKRYLPIIIKNLELYLLHHISEAASSGALSFKVVQKYPGGPMSNVKLENKNICEDVKDFIFDRYFLSENSSSDYDYDHDTDRSSFDAQSLSNDISDYYSQNSSSFDLSTMSQNSEISSSKLNDRLSKIETILKKAYEFRAKYPMSKSISSMIQDMEREKSSLLKIINYASGSSTSQRGVSDMRIDTSTVYDLRPTSMVIRVNVIRKKWTFGKGIPYRKETSPMEMTIPLSVKIIPIFVDDFKSVENVMINDSFKSSFSSVYTSFIRSMGSRMIKLFRPLFSIFENKKFELWKDVLLNKKGLFDASSFSSQTGHLSFSKYAASLIILSSNDVKRTMNSIIENPTYMSKLFRMGWNTIVVADDASKQLTLCAQFDGGYCKQIPYSYLFKTSGNYDLFKDLDDLSKFVNRFQRNVTPIGNALKNLKENIKNQFDKKVKIVTENKTFSYADVRFENILKKYRKIVGK